MLRQTVFRMILFLTTLAACTQSSVAPEPSVPKIAKVVPPTRPINNGAARLVTAAEVKRWPHLKRHVGQLLLANASTHVVFPTASPLTTGQSFFALMSKVYRFDGKEWNAVPWVPSIDIRLNGAGDESLQLIGQDIVQDQSAIQAYFRQKQSGAADVGLLLTLDAKEARIHVQVTGARYSWTVRVGRAHVEDYLIPVSGDRYAGVTSTLLPYVFSVLGERSFTLIQDENYNYLTARPEHPGFDVLLARDALLHQLSRVEERLPCYAGDKPDPNCLKTPGTQGAWRITAPAVKAPDQPFWQTLLFYNKQGSFRSLLSIREGETLDLSALTREKIEVLYADSSGMLKKKKLSRKNKATIVLPPLRKGTAVLNLTSRTPAFVELRSATHTDGKTLEAWLPSGERTLLSTNTLLRAKWPFSLKLPTGDYHVRIYDGYRVFCEQRLAILEARAQALECSAGESHQSLTVRASISADHEAVSEDQIAASGITVMTSSNFKDAPAGSVTTLPMLAAFDAELGLSMHALPVTKEMETAWDNYLKDKPGGASLKAFVEFVRSKDPEHAIDLVLDCPSPGFEISEYEWIAQTLKPDVLEVFGCLGSAPTFFKVAQSLQQKNPRPLRFAAASFNGPQYGARVPALYLSRYTTREALDPRKVRADLHEGRYTLGYRTELVLPAVRAADADLKITLKGPDFRRNPLVLRTYDQDEMLSEDKVTAGEAYEQTFTVKLRLKTSSRLFRVEVLMAEEESGEKSPLFVLASSNFFGLDASEPRPTLPPETKP